MTKLSFSPRQTALVAIDLQASNLARQLLPHPADQVLARSLAIAGALRAAGGTVIWVRVDVNALLSLPADQPVGRPAGSPALPESASALAPAVLEEGADLVVTKRNWSAFYGTELDLLLRRRGIKTLVMAGIATNFGVESTARGAFDRGYELVFAEDAMSSVSVELHQFSTCKLFPHIGHVRSTTEIVDAIGK